MMAPYSCCAEDRRRILGEHAGLQGIDYVEVSPDQATIFVYFLPAAEGSGKDPVPRGLAEGAVRITGGERVTEIRVTGVSYDGDVLVVLVADDSAATSGVGDFSTYTLHLAAPALDPRLASIDFSFKAGCASDFDPQAVPVCPTGPPEQPELSYLAKDYASFRQLMLDRMSLLVPGWTERNPADAGIALVELLAHAGDLLSYRQDAVATEAYLHTARLRTSVRRHVRLVDYDMHDGCNARTWVQVRVSAARLHLPAGTQLLTRVENQPVRIAPGAAAYVEALGRGPEVFETVTPAALYAAHNCLAFYTWGDRDCCLPAGATAATLAGPLPHLAAGDVLVFVQQRDPVTGLAEDADRNHRHAVRLAHVRVIQDPLGGRLDPEAPDDDPRPVTRIEWAAADALPFPFCISGTGSESGAYHDDITVALGNIVLADHGRSLPYPELFHEGRVLAGPALPQPEKLPAMPAAAMILAPGRGAGHARCARPARELVPVRYRPRLRSGPLAQAVPCRQAPLFALPFAEDQGAELDAGTLPAALRRELVERGLQPDPDEAAIQGGTDAWSLSDGRRSLILRREPGSPGGGDLLNVYALPPPAREIARWGPRDARPAIVLYSPAAGDADRRRWTPVRHLLNSGPSSREFVVEVEDDGSATLRFGDDRFGLRPNQGTTFEAAYRVGSGSRGNIGADTLYHVASSDPGIDAVTNPLPAWGGVEPESSDHARQMAPYAFRTQERAVTPDDYAEVAMRHPGVQRAAASVRWTGSWFTVHLTVDRFGGLEVDAAFERELVRFLDRYRMAGQDLEIEGPHYVPLEIEMRVCVSPDASRSDVAGQLLRTYSAHLLPDGRRGVFHPDNFTFGQPVYLSQVYRAAEGIPGIASYEITTFQRQGAPGKGLDEGKLALGRLEIARLDNDPNFPEHGVFRLTLEGGR